MPFNHAWFRGIVIVCIFGISSWVFHEILIVPKLKMKESLDRQIQKEGLKIQETLSAFPDLAKVRKDLEDEGTQVSELKRDLARKETGVLAAGQVEALLKGDTLRQKGEHLQEAVIAGGDRKQVRSYAQQVFRVKLRANYGGVVGYLNTLEEGSKFLRPRSLKMKQEPAGVETPPYAELELEAVYQQKMAEKSGRLKPLQKSLPVPGMDGVRDPFVFSRKADQVQGSEPGVLYLTELIFRGSDRYAVINGRWLQKGDRLSEKVFVKGVTSHQVILTKSGVDQALTLQS